MPFEIPILTLEAVDSMPSLGVAPCIIGVDEYEPFQD
jgi:hypothetical protein